MEVLSRPEDLIRGNRQLDDNLRQSAVLLTFATPVNRALCGEFLCIRLTVAMLSGGEQEFYQTEVVQPHRAQPQRCVGCRQPMHRVGLMSWECRRAMCSQYGLSQVAGPSRGVVKIAFTPDFIARTERIRIESTGETVVAEYLNRVILMLDRRYRPEVLAGVYRTAGMICDKMGWRLNR